MKTRPLIIIIAGLIIVGLLTIPKGLQKTSLRSPETNTSSWETFRSKRYGYSLEHPAGWTVNDSKFASSQEILVSDPAKNAAVRINAFYDKSINSEEAIKKSVLAFKEKMNADSNLKVVTFEDFQDPQANAVRGFIATGEQTINNGKYLFTNKGLLAPNGRILIFHGIVKIDLKETYGDTISKIIESFNLDKNT